MNESHFFSKLGARGLDVFQELISNIFKQIYSLRANSGLYWTSIELYRSIYEIFYDASGSFGPILSHFWTPFNVWVHFRSSYLAIDFDFWLFKIYFIKKDMFSNFENFFHSYFRHFKLILDILFTLRSV